MNKIKENNMGIIYSDTMMFNSKNELVAGKKELQRVLNTEFIIFDENLIYNEDNLYFVDLIKDKKHLVNIKNICFLETEKWANCLTNKIRPAWINKHILLCSIPYYEKNIFRMTWKT